MNRNRLRFILTELQLATTFLEVADTTGSPEARARHLVNAQRALASAKDVFAMVQCTDQQRADIDARLAAVHDMLEAVARARASRPEGRGGTREDARR